MGVFEAGVADGVGDEEEGDHGEGEVPPFI